MELSAAGVALVISTALIVLSETVPGFSQWWELLAGDYKRAAFSIAGLVVSAGLIGLHYAGALELGLGPFDWEVIWRGLVAWLSYIGASQGAYTVTRLVRDGGA